MALQDTKADGLLVKKTQEHLYEMGLTLGKYLCDDLLSLSVKKISPFDETLLQGVQDGTFSDPHGKNIKILIDQGFLNEKDVGLFLEKFVKLENLFSPRRKNYDQLFSPSLHLKVLETLFEHGDLKIQQTVVLGCGQIAGRGDGEEAQVANKFFGKHYTINQAEHMLHELHKDYGFSWVHSSRTISYKNPTKKNMLPLFRHLMKTPSETLLRKMQPFDEVSTFSELFDQNIAQTFRNFLKEYEKMVLMQEMPKKPSGMTKKM